jgi:predicted ABC-type ATPase
LPGSRFSAPPATDSRKIIAVKLQPGSMYAHRVRGVGGSTGCSDWSDTVNHRAAGRLMVERIGDLVTAGKSFAFETTLATRGYLRLIPAWQDAGYQVKLCFLRLPNAGFAIRRVAQRVSLGGHDIPPDTIRRRFERGWANLQNDYLGIVDEWAIYDSSQVPPVLLESGDNLKS